MRAVWNGVTLAESDETIVVEGNHYFPQESVEREHFERKLDAHALPMEGDRRLLHGARRGKQ